MKKFHAGIIIQVAAFFLIGLLVCSQITYYSQYSAAQTSVLERTEAMASDTAREVMTVVREYPAYRWLISYWRDHAEEMDIEYDAGFGTENDTSQKYRLLARRYPVISLRYLQDPSILSEQDQKLFAEITYSWLITRVDQIKRSYSMDFLFCVMTEPPYGRQFFLFSGADEGEVRGTEYEQVYTLGVETTVGESQQQAMRSAVRDSAHLADAGNYMDYYAYLDQVDGSDILIGMTYNLTDLRSQVLSQARRQTCLSSLLMLCLSAICLALIGIFILRPLKKVQRNIRLYRDTKDSEKVVQDLSGIRSRNEIGQLSGDVSSMALELDDHTRRIAAITAEKERISTELSVAARIQANTLPNVFPPFPDRSEFEIHASMDPAKEVGGDFYDFFMIDPDHLAVVIADVSGKGVPAALFMMVSMILIHGDAARDPSPANVLQQVNDKICARNPEQMFVSVWLGVLEISTGKMKCANAGHEYPCLKHGNGLFEVLRNRHGFVVGGMPDITYRDYELQLQPGDRLYLYTDGVPEAANDRLEPFGMDRMVRALNTAPAQVSPRQLLEHMRMEVDAFVGGAEQFDDMTMLCLEYKGPAGDA